MQSLDANENLVAHIAQADPAVLLASLVGITGEGARIEKFAPSMSHLYEGGIHTTLPNDLRQELNEWATQVLSDLERYSDRDPLQIEDYSFLSLVEAMVGWPHVVSSLPFLREQGGFVSFVPTVERTVAAPKTFKLAIIGAGMAGIAMAIAAKTAGIDFVVLEKREGLGGVWWQNRYPGVGVDTPSKYYSFSFEINPDWTHSHPSGHEYLEYLNRVAVEYGVLEKFQFGADVASMAWSESTKSWTVSYLFDGRQVELTVDAVVTAAGYFTDVQLPEVPGIEVFEGQWFHSATWDHSIELADKRVAVVGTGCTSVQIVDAIADTVAALTLFQRQPHWVLPPSAILDLSESERWLLRNVPAYANWERLQTFLAIGDANYPAVRYDAEWASTHDRSISERNHALLEFGMAYLQASFAERPDLLEKMTPDFAVMGKRPVRDPGGYFAALTKSTSSVVTSGLSTVVPKGIVDGDGTLHEVDVIIYATGFKLEYLSHVETIGRNGQRLAEVWGDSPAAYNSCMVPEFPNFFVTSGPNGSAAHGGGHNFTVEAVVHYIIECLQTLFETGCGSIEATEESLDRWNEEIQELLVDSIWARERRATTYYRNSKGEVIVASPLRMEDFWNRLREPKSKDMMLR